jgi:UDP-N-acetylmuramoyl-tripeptide--D-alanyl-D-alanine ligase
MIDGEWLGPTKPEAVKTKGVSTDTRTIKPGEIYIPLSGPNFDGHQFASDAFQSGASMMMWRRDNEIPEQLRQHAFILVDDPLQSLQQMASEYRRQSKARVLAITGSNGKTTTKDMAAAILSQSFRTAKTAGNLNNHIGLPLTILQMDEETEMLVVEMGMSGRGEIRLLSRIARPDAAVITNIGEAHIEQLGSREGIAAAKLEIVEGLSTDGCLIINGDEPLLKKAEHHRLIRFGFAQSCDWRPEHITDNGIEGTTLRLPGWQQSIHIALPGKHHVYNALAAVAAATVLGASREDVISGFDDFRPTQMRMQVIKASADLHIVNDCYNASPTSMAAAIEWLAAVQGYGTKIALLGDMLELGADEADYHRRAGELIAGTDIDWVLTVGKRAEWIIDGAVAGGFSEERAKHFASVDETVSQVLDKAERKTLVLVKASRGMKLERAVERILDERRE